MSGSVGQTAIRWMARAITANNCYMRISGSAQAVKEARSKIAGDVLPDADAFWHALREHRAAFLHACKGTLYRIMVKPATPPLNIEGTWLLDWGGAQRWLYSNEDVVIDPPSCRNGVAVMSPCFAAVHQATKYSNRYPRRC